MMKVVVTAGAIRHESSDQIITTNKPNTQLQAVEGINVMEIISFSAYS